MEASETVTSVQENGNGTKNGHVVTTDGVVDTEKKVRQVETVDPAEKKKLQAMIGNPKEQTAKYIIGKKGEKETLGEDSHKPQATIYFKNCSDCEYIVDSLCTKILIEGCSNCTITFNKKIVTSIVDIWRSNDMILKANAPIGTLQADVCKKLLVDYQQKSFITMIVWAGVTDLTVHFQDSLEDHLETGFAQVQKLFTNLSEEIDQFIIRFVKGKLLSEQIVRLTNGYPTTEREAKEFDRKQEELLQKLAKDAGITIGKKKNPDKVKPNEPCTCGSGKKYKKCHGKNE